MRKFHLYIWIVQFFLFLSITIQIQAQTPAVQTAKMTSGGTGYLEHLPPDYATSTKKYPIIFFLHGAGEVGSGSAADLEKLKSGGPPKEMKNGHNMCFTVNGVEECFIVISPQLKSGLGGWWPGVQQGVFDYVMNGPENYRIDKTRVYLTGLSMGGQGVYMGLGETTDIFAAAGVIAGFDNGNGCTISARKISMWGFHGESDGTIVYSRGLADFQKTINCTTPVPTAEYKWTSYPGVGHNAWDRAFKPDHTYHNPNLYEWLLTKNKSSLPAANAGLDKGITLPTNTVTLAGSGTIGGGGTIAGYAWQQTAGVAATLTNASTASLTVSGLLEGRYIFRLTVTDNNGNTAFDDVIVAVSPAAVNAPPVITLSASVAITLPTNSVNLIASASDNDGTVVSYLWTQQSGPSTATFPAGVNLPTISVSTLIEGSYVFRITATDDDAATSFKDITVIVNPAAVNKLPTASAGVDKSVNLPTNTINITGTGSDTDGTITSYLWEKTNGPTATLVNAGTAVLTVNDLVVGLYTFRLTVKDNAGASATDDVIVTVVAANQSPVANAGSDIPITLPTSSTTISGSGNDPDGSISAYAWTQVGGPLTATLSNASTAVVSVSNMTTAGTYTFRLMVTDNKSATGTDDVVVKVNAAPVNVAPIANAGPDVSKTLPLTSLTILGLGSDSDGSVASYSWIRVSGPSTITMSNASTASLALTNLVAGFYSFQLTVTDNLGLASTDIMLLTVQPAIVNQAPVANAGQDKFITLPLNSSTLNGTGSDNDGTIASYAWTKQSGPTSGTLSGQSSSTLTLSTLVAGIYVFRLTVTDDKGATNFDDVNVTVSAINTAPIASVGQDIILQLPSNGTDITGEGSDGDGTIASYLWSQTEGPSVAVLTNKTTTKLSVGGLIAGSYTFRFTVTDDDGATGYDDVKVIVNAANQVPVVSAGEDQFITLPTSSINLTGTATDDVSISYYSWTQQSGPTAYLTNVSTPVVSIVFYSSATYVFRLTATDNQGGSSFDEVTVLVNEATVNQPPLAFAGENQTVNLPVNSTVIEGTGTDTDGSISTYSWIKVSGPDVDLVNENTPSLSLLNLVQATYLFRLTVTDNGGLSATSDVTINVLPSTINQSPIANAGDDQQLTLPLNSITLFGNGSDADGSVANYEWIQISGPEATIANAVTATLTLSEMTEGIYVFRFTVTDDQSASSSDEVIITVNAEGVNQDPVVDVGEDRIINLPTSSATIEANASDPDGSIVSYQWTRQSGPSASLSNASTATLTVSDLVEGTYVFQLTVTDDKGAADSDEITLIVLSEQVNQSPLVETSELVSLILPVNTTKLTGTASDSDGTIVSYLWTKVAGGAAALQDETTPILTLVDLELGVYRFRLTATDNNGATGTDEVEVDVNPAGTNVAPTADAGLDITVKLPLNSVTINGIGTDIDGSIAGYLWEKVSGSSVTLTGSTTPALSVFGLAEGQYSFRLSVTDNGGLTNSDDVKVNVVSAITNSNPIANAGDDASITLPKNSIVITGSGTDEDGTIAAYTWKKTSGPTAIESGNTTPQLSLSALTSGTYIYKLTVTDNVGAMASDDVIIIVLPDPGSEIRNDPPIAFAGEDQVLQPGITTALLVGSFEDTGLVDRYTWQQTSGTDLLLSALDNDSLKIQKLTTGNYVFEFVVTDVAGASDADEVMITVNGDLATRSDKFFTPNGDGINDYWELDAHANQSAGCKIIIMDGRGLRVFSADSYKNNWDGTSGGKQLPEDVYYYVLECGGSKKTGSITLVR